MFTGMRVTTLLCELQVALGSFPLLLSYCWRQDLLLNLDLTTWLDWLGGKLWDPSVCPSVLGPHTCWLSVGAWDLNLVPLTSQHFTHGSTFPAPGYEWCPLPSFSSGFSEKLVWCQFLINLFLKLQYNFIIYPVFSLQVVLQPLLCFPSNSGLFPH